ncbi:MAG: hypothetical protein DRO40_00575 [Thermoprotei archaeon]|nr:MAG: hypothetical protein DRO40_00575 [Thermoprotei archaeon]
MKLLVALVLSIIILAVFPVLVTFSADFSWLREDNYLQYDMYRVIKYYNLNKTSQATYAFNNETLWAKLSAIIVGFNETHIVFNFTIVDTNDTAGNVFVVGKETTVAIEKNFTLEKALSLYLNPDLFPGVNGVYYNETSGLSQYGIYRLRYGIIIDPEKGLMRGFVGRYLINASSSELGLNGYFIAENTMIYKLVNTNINGLELLSKTEYNGLYETVFSEDPLPTLTRDTESTTSPVEEAEETNYYLLAIAIIALIIVGIFIIKTMKI